MADCSHVPSTWRLPLVSTLIILTGSRLYGPSDSSAGYSAELGRTSTYALYVHAFPWYGESQVHVLSTDFGTDQVSRWEPYDQYLGALHDNPRTCLKIPVVLAI
jgi:hypothetical protein